jgi:hypothetical protein
VHRDLPAPLAEFLELDFALNLLLVLVRIIIAPFADGAAERDQIVRIFNLCHMGHDTPIAPKTQLP